MSSPAVSGTWHRAVRKRPENSLQKERAAGSAVCPSFVAKWMSPSVEPLSNAVEMRLAAASGNGDCPEVSADADSIRRRPAGVRMISIAPATAGVSTTNASGPLLATCWFQSFIDLEVAGGVGLPRHTGEAHKSRYSGPNSPDGITAIAEAAGLPGINRLAKAFTEIPFVLVLVGLEMPDDIVVE